MMPDTIVGEAAKDGVRLTITAAGTIKVLGDAAAVDRWIPAIQANRDSVLAALIASAHPEVPARVSRVIDVLMRVGHCRTEDREAFIEDWRERPELAEQAFRDLIDLHEAQARRFAPDTAARAGNAG